ncbi:MAG: hypothetical protein OXR62_08220 [Ahrensia sp.]|nr:hypothetical protein [Ahrensia sp.]
MRLVERQRDALIASTGVDRHNGSQAGLRNDIMIEGKRYSAVFGCAVAAVWSHVAAAADADCEDTFRALLRGESGEYPFTARSVTEFSGTKTVSIFAAQSPSTSLTIDERTGVWVVFRDGKAWQSADKGKSWKHLYDLPAKQADQIRESLAKRAAAATNIACADGVEFEGGTYRSVSGEWQSGDATNADGRSTYFLKADGSWHAAITEMTMTSGSSTITQVKLPEAEWLDVPTPE